MKTIKWEPKAIKQAKKIKDVSLRKKIYLEAQALVNFPDCMGIKKLTNHQYSYRLRIGDYRLFFDFDEKIIVQEIRKRDERTY